MSALRVVFLWSIFAGMGIGFGCRVLAQATTGTSLPDAPSPVRSEPGAQGIYKIGGDVKAPELTLTYALDFSQVDRRKEKDPRSGTIVVEMVVDVKGVPQQVHVVYGVGPGIDAAAVEAVRQYRFKPAMKGDTPVPVYKSVKVTFQFF
jgi:TonB family protein